MSKLYNTWSAMLQRCTNPNNPRYKDYGGRGITICEEWRQFKNFLKDMGEPPKGQTLDRKDNALGYSKSNCRWATHSQQNLNKRPRHDNKTGVIGVRFDPRGKWLAVCTEQKRDKQLYWGLDFFEACCARKSWDARATR